MVTLNSDFFVIVLAGGIDKLNEGAVVQPVRTQFYDGREKLGKHFFIRVLYPPNQTCLSCHSIPNDDNLPENTSDISFRLEEVKFLPSFSLLCPCLSALSHQLILINIPQWSVTLRQQLNRHNFQILTLGECSPFY